MAYMFLEKNICLSFSPSDHVFATLYLHMLSGKEEVMSLVFCRFWREREMKGERKRKRDHARENILITLRPRLEKARVSSWERTNESQHSDVHSFPIDREGDGGKVFGRYTLTISEWEKGVLRNRAKLLNAFPWDLTNVLNEKMF